MWKLLTFWHVSFKFHSSVSQYSIVEKPILSSDAIWIILDCIRSSCGNQASLQEQGDFLGRAGRQASSSSLSSITITTITATIIHHHHHHRQASASGASAASASTEGSGSRQVSRGSLGGGRGVGRSSLGGNLSAIIVLLFFFTQQAPWPIKTTSRDVCLSVWLCVSEFVC